MSFPDSSLGSPWPCRAVCACPGMWSMRLGVSEMPSSNDPACLSPYILTCGLRISTRLCQQPWEGQRISCPALMQRLSSCAMCPSSLGGGACSADPQPFQPFLAGLVCCHLFLQTLPLLILFTPPTGPSPSLCWGICHLGHLLPRTQELSDFSAC